MKTSQLSTVICVQLKYKEQSLEDWHNSDSHTAFHRNTSIMSIDDVLLKYFCFSKFRPGQKEAIEAIAVHHRDVLCLFPTGAGKSLCYQLPILLESQAKFAIIVSPLIALIDISPQIFLRSAENIELYSPPAFFQNNCW